MFWNASVITKLLKKLCCQIPDDQPKVYNFISLKKLGFADIPFSGHLGEKVVILECISDKTINCDGYRCKPQCISPAICLTLESYKYTWHRTSHIDPESAKNCQILAWETCNVYINCDINSNHDSTTLTISTEIDRMVSVIFNMHFNENLKNVIENDKREFYGFWQLSCFFNNEVKVFAHADFNFHINTA